jgi:hypothetical protein
MLAGENQFYPSYRVKVGLGPAILNQNYFLSFLIFKPSSIIFSDCYMVRQDRIHLNSVKKSYRFQMRNPSADAFSFCVFCSPKGHCAKTYFTHFYLHYWVNSVYFIFLFRRLISFQLQFFNIGK